MAMTRASQGMFMFMSQSSAMSSVASCGSGDASANNASMPSTTQSIGAGNQCSEGPNSTPSTQKSTT